MISVDEIDRTILDLEQKDTSYAVCEKLSWLYICRDHLRPTRAQEPRTVNAQPESLFLAAANGKPVDQVLAIINEHMEGIKLIYPREYDRIINRIRSIE